MASPETYHAEGPSRDKADEVEEDVEHEEREDALVHLVASGRVENREAAERYLDTLHQIKVKLLQFARDQVSREPGTQQKLYFDERGVSRPAVITEADLVKTTADDLDRNDPGLWKLERTVAPSPTDYLPEEQASFGYNGVAQKDRLEIGLLHGPSVFIHPDHIKSGRNTFLKLRDYLSEEDFAFMAKAYGYAAKDLARKLRAVADRVADYTAPADSWERFSSEDRK
jgi:hypothetical protein